VNDSSPAGCLPGTDAEERKEASMTAHDQPGDGVTAVLRRQPTHVIDGQAQGPYTDAFEIICRGCGDDPGLDYCEVSPRLQLVRGPYPIKDGIAAYETHLRLHRDRQRTETGDH